MKDETITGSTDSNGLFTAKNPYLYQNGSNDWVGETELEYKRRVDGYREYAEAHLPLFCYNENNVLVKGVEGLEVKPWWRYYDGAEMKIEISYEERINSLKQRLETEDIYIAVQPTEKPKVGEIWVDCIHNKVEILEVDDNVKDRYSCRKLKNGCDCYRDISDLSYRVDAKGNPISGIVTTTPLPEAQPLEGVKTAEEILKSFSEWNYGQYRTQDVLSAMNEFANQEKSKSVELLQQRDDLITEMVQRYLKLKKRCKSRRNLIRKGSENAQFATDAGGGKETLSKAFSAGELFANDCRCGECDYCDLYPDKEPNFEEWYALTAPSTHSSSEMVEDDDFDDYDCLPGGHAAV